MVISTVNQVVYNGDGVTTAWPFTFRIIEATDIKLLLIDADGAETDITADYYVDTVNNTVYYPGYAPGAEPPAEDQPPKVQTGQKLVVYRELPITQEKDLGEKWPFYVIELGLDKLTMILQQIFDWWGRTLKISQGGSVDGFDTNIYPEAGKVIAVNEDGDGFTSVTAMTEENNAWDGKGMQIKSVAEPTDAQDAATKGYADGNFMKLQDGGEAWEGRGIPIRNVYGPVQVNDAATKDYVDRILNGFVLAGDSRTVPFDTLVQLKASDIEAGQIAFTLGYHDVNDGGAGVYTIRNATPSDVDDGGSIIILDNGSVAELIVTDEVNINQFGGVGDGTTDDNVAIVNAVAYASAKKYRLVFLEGRTYLTSAGIVIANPPKEIKMDGRLLYKGNGTALTIGNSSENVSYKIFTINVYGSSSHVAGSIGVKLINVTNSTIYLTNITYFGDCCVEMRGDTKGFVYNNIFVGYIASAPVCVRLTSVGAGWCNENKFFGGKIAVYSNDSFKSTSIGILVTSDGNCYQNNNIFYSPCLEGLAVGARIEYGTQHFFYDVRAESTTKPLDIDDSRINNAYNYMFASYGTNSYYVKTDLSTNPAYLQDGANEYANFNTNLRKSFPIALFDSGVIADNLADNGTHTSVGKMTACYGGNMNVYTTSARADITSGELKVLPQLKIGACISTVNNKTFLVEALTDSKCRFIVWQWDANGNVITNNEPIYTVVTVGTSRGKLSTLGTSGVVKDGYYLGADAVPCMLLTVASNCVKAFIGVTTGTVTSFTLNRFRVYARFDDKVYTLQNYETAVLGSIPTSVGKVGQFVKKTVPTQGEIGWTYDGANWLTVGDTQPTTSSSAPIDGDHVVGEIVYNDTPTAGGYVGWVCVAAGTPGTWKGFGEIEA